jgi:hypothetical protein
MVFNATSNNISVDIVVVSFTEGENHHQKFQVVSFLHDLTVNIFSKFNLIHSL